MNESEIEIGLLYWARDNQGFFCPVEILERVACGWSCLNRRSRRRLIIHRVEQFTSVIPRLVDGRGKD